MLENTNIILSNNRYKFIIETLCNNFSELKHINPEDIVIVSNIKVDYKEKIQKLIYADITKISDRLFEVISQYYNNKNPFKYILQIYENHITELSLNQLIIVIYHELLHIGEDGILINHDFEDFYAVIDKTKDCNWCKIGYNINSILPDNITKNIQEHLSNSELKIN